MTLLTRLLIVAIFALETAACSPEMEEAYVATMYSPQTDYAAGFDDAAFSTVTLGMSRPEVLERVGNPIRESQIENITFLVYSDIGHYTRRYEKAYRQRWLALDDTKSVVHVFRRTITADADPTYPVGWWAKDEHGVYQPVILPPYSRQKAGVSR